MPLMPQPNDPPKLPFRHVKWVFLLAAFQACLFACRPDENYYKPSPSRAGSILSELAKDPQYSLFREALESAGYKAALGGGAGLYTVFAPNNESVQAFLAANGYDALTAIPLNQLNKFLGNHLISSRLLYPYDFQSQKFNQKKDNRYLSVGDKALTILYQGPGNFTVNGVPVTGEARGTGNGVLYTVQNFLTPQKSLDSLLQTTPAYSEFYKLVARFKRRIFDPRIRPNPIERPDGTKDSILVTVSDLAWNIGDDADVKTVFAPTNEAVSAFLATTPYATVDALPRDAAKLLVEYHIVPPKSATEYTPALRSSDLKAGDTLTTAAKEKLVVGTDLSPADLVQPDQVTSNGLLHGISKVLVPPGLR